MLSRDRFFPHLLSQLPDQPRDLGALAFLDGKPLPKEAESWRFTDLSALQQPWSLATQPGPQPSPPPIQPPYHPIYVSNGFVDLSQLPPMIQVGIPSPEHPFADEFAALNILCTPQPVHLQVKQSPSAPLLIVYDTEPGLSSHPHLSLELAPHTELTLMEWFQGQGWTNSLTHIHLAPGSRFYHHRWQAQHREQGIHIGGTQVSQARDSQYQLVAVHRGSRLSRHSLGVISRGAGTVTDLKGLTWIGGEQISDTHSSLTLEQPHCTSRHLHKNIVQDQGHAIFWGRIHVQPGAQFSDASQSSRTLLLSPKARVDTQPQLEIQADDVKCSHGATVSELDPELIFYL
ncbi:MAG: SufD family Fe-S cluster assembly protein, partial [Thermostichales cyanobacterium DRC_bins_46]